MLYIRPININDDFNQYMRCVQDLNGSGVSVCNFEQMKRSLLSRQSNMVTYVLVVDDKILATATCLFEKKIRYNQPCCHIEDVGVDPDHRKRSYGKLIVDHCVSMAKSKNCYKVKLCCSNDLLNWYSGMGFKKTNNGMERVL